MRQAISQNKRNRSSLTKSLEMKTRCKYISSNQDALKIAQLTHHLLLNLTNLHGKSTTVSYLKLRFG